MGMEMEMETEMEMANGEILCDIYLLAACFCHAYIPNVCIYDSRRCLGNVHMCILSPPGPSLRHFVLKTG